MNHRLIKVDALHVHYVTQKTVKHAISNISFELEQGQCLALVGESGCGKTTLAKTVAGLLSPSAGTIQCLENRMPLNLSLSLWHKAVQIVFQDPDSVFNPKRTILWHFDEVLTLWHPNLSKTDKREKLLRLLASVELEQDIIHRHSFELSGGQKQRASIARSLLVEPSFLILDEPLASQDASKRKQLLTLLKNVQQQFSLGYLYITHDLSTLSHIANKIGVMYDGNLIELQNTTNLLTHPKHPYTIKLLTSSIQRKITLKSSL